jgi:predicted anti-sigma-YlaC factor YlaD
VSDKKKLLIRHPGYASLLILMVSLTIYYSIGYINGHYPTYEQPVLFQTIYLVLSAVAFGCCVLSIVMLIQQKVLFWKMSAGILIVLTSIVAILCVLGIASVNFF